MSLTNCLKFGAAIKEVLRFPKKTKRIQYFKRCTGIFLILLQWMIKETKYKYIVTKGIKMDFKGDEMSYKKFKL